MKKKRLLILVAMALLIVPVVTSAATIDIFGPSLVSGNFSFEVFLDSSALEDVDFWQVDLGLSPATPVSFTGGSDAGSNYIFFGDSDGFQAVNPGGDVSRIQFGDLTASGTGVTDFAGKLLATVNVDITGASNGDIFSVDLFGGATNNYFYSAAFDQEAVTLVNAPYEFQVVPIPAAAWLLGAGLLGLVGLRRKSS